MEEKVTKKNSNQNEVPLEKVDKQNNIVEQKNKSVELGESKKDSLFTKWQFWAIGGGIIALIVAGILFGTLMGNNGTQDGQNDTKKTSSSCVDGATDMISGGEWVVGEDIASGIYLIESSGYYSAYIYSDVNASSYTKSLYSSSDEKSYVYFADGQKIKVNSGSIDMTCKEIDGVELLTASATMKAGNYTLIAGDRYFYAYIYDEKGDDSYTATISISSSEESEDFRFKEGQYVKVSSGNAFMINKSSTNYDELVKKVKALIAELDGTESESSDSSESSSSASSSNTSSSSNSSSSTNSSDSTTSSSDWKQLLKDYEAWVDKYIAFMKKYKNASASDLTSMLSDYNTLMSDMTKWTEKVQNMKGTLSGSDLTEYVSTLTRITNKMSNI